MAFNWERFLSSRGITYATKGHGATRNHVMIRCPMCGAEDQGMHMSIDTTGKGWRCLRRSREHKGIKAAPLIKALLQCSYEAAAVIADERISLPDDWAARVKELMAGDAAPKRKQKKLELPPEFKPFGTGRYRARLFENYLQGRGFTQRQIDRMTEDYGLRYGASGRFQDRIIFPVYFEGRLMGWTGRAVHKSAGLRLMTLESEPNPNRPKEPVALAPISNFFIWYDDIMRGDFETFVLVEGPFDALKINVLGRREGYCATCFFTQQPSDAQIDLLHTMMPRFKRRVLMLDRKTEHVAMYVNGLLSEDFEIIRLDKDKDPGELNDLRLLKRRLK